jgi:UDP-2-acetamido-2,6-beta-L-arabino-hexul-4-ose reductase
MLNRMGRVKILVTGAKGFVGKNLIAALRNLGYSDIWEYDIDTDPTLLDGYCQEAEYVFHLAGVNRPVESSEFMEGNFGFTERLLEAMKRAGNKCPVMFASSTQATLDNLYGKSKKAGEDLLFAYARDLEVKVLVYRFPNMFGKWCRPNYNSGIATFCFNITHDLSISVNDPNVVMSLVYIDDVVEEMLQALQGKENRIGDFCAVPTQHTISLGAIVDLLYSFKKSRGDLSIPWMADSLTRKLYATYLSYLPENEFSYPLQMNKDQRGSFTEFLKTPDRGQVSVNISKPGIIKGNHWHQSKTEKFLVVTGNGVIRFRKIGTTSVSEYPVSGDFLQVVDIPPGYTHSITNLGSTDMVTIMWASEVYDKAHPDTYPENVILL